ncbi:MAG: Fe-S-containing hydro-lyase [Candidatus Limivicinus sp.]|nr:Fe-S-containing hydro-lyase [Candidatus Limivicinus sp.]
MEYVMSFPADKAELSKLRAGDKLTVSGTIYTARDAAHKRLTELIASGEELPLDIRGAAIYYAGPTPEKPGQVIGSCGPTTSGRMDAYAPGLLDRGLAVMIGKGDRNAAVIDAIVRNGAVYLAAMGGAGALMGSCVKAARIVCYEDLGCEAIRELKVENMPLTVVIDSQGNDLYKSGPEAYLKSLED